MFRIIDTNGNIIAQVDDLRYVKLKTHSLQDGTEYKVWVRCNATDAQCIAVNGIRYSLAGKPIVDDAPTVVYVYQIDAAAELLNAVKSSNVNAHDIELLSNAINLMANEIVQRLDDLSKVEYTA